MPDLGPAVSTVVERCLAVKPDEQVVVVADAGTLAIGEALRGAARTAGADAVLAIMDEREIDGTEPPPTIAAALGRLRRVHRADDALDQPHVVARRRASEAGARGATMPGVTEDMLARMMAGDFDAMAGALAGGRGSC